MGPQLVEAARQELRSRLWLALIDNPLLCHTYDEGKVYRHHSHDGAQLINQCIHRYQCAILAYLLQQERFWLLTKMLHHILADSSTSL